MTAESAERDASERWRALRSTEGAELAALARADRESVRRRGGAGNVAGLRRPGFDPARRAETAAAAGAPGAARGRLGVRARRGRLDVRDFRRRAHVARGPAGSRGFGSSENLEHFVACIPAFRLTAIPILWLWCWAGVTRACTAHYVNYRFIMEVSRSEEAGWRWNAALAATLTAAWLACFALFSARVRFGVDPFGFHSVPAYYPLALVVFVLSLLAVPPSSIFAARDVARKGASLRRARRALQPPRARVASALDRALGGGAVRGASAVPG